MSSNLKSFKTAVYFLAIFACLGTRAFAQDATGGNRLAAVSSASSSVRWAVSAPHASGTLTVVAPDGEVFRKEFKAGAALSFDLTDAQGAPLPDGNYVYELRLTPVLTDAAKKALTAERGDNAAVGRERSGNAAVARSLRRRGLRPPQPLVQSGGFAVINGVVVVEGSVEGQRLTEPARVSSRRAPMPPADAIVAPPRDAFGARDASFVSVRSGGPRALRAPMPDDVIPDDLIVQGSTCSGLDCVNGEVFGFDTVRLKENNTRLQFEDTSNTAGFPTNNWQIRANSSASGGGSFLAFVDQGDTGNSETGTIVFEVDAGAPANSLRVSGTGQIGLRTATPVLDLHVNTSDTPAFRFEQNNSGGFTAQTWDVGANEANFFVRDVTGGSRLPLRIRPGAPTSSIDIAAGGNVGIGKEAPAAKLHVAGAIFADGNLGIGGRVFAVGNAAVGNSAFASFGNLSTMGSGELGLLLGRTSTTTGAVVIQATKEGVGFNDLTLQPSGGRLGIGTTAPDQTLSVNGDASKAGGGSWQTFSDERLKNIKGSFRAGLDAVMRLQPLRYEYRNGNPLGLNSNGQHVGFGAQALQKVIPEAVTRGDNGYLLVNNDPVMWAMLNAIKEQQQQIEGLREEVRRLRAPRRAAASARRR